jgi:hypothetical protein
MTAKRDTKSKPKKGERPKLKKEKLRDLTPDGAGVRGGRPRAPTYTCVQGGGGGDCFDNS